MAILQHNGGGGGYAVAAAAAPGVEHLKFTAILMEAETRDVNSSLFRSLKKIHLRHDSIAPGTSSSIMRRSRATILRHINHGQDDGG